MVRFAATRSSICTSELYKISRTRKDVQRAASKVMKSFARLHGKPSSFKNVVMIKHVLGDAVHFQEIVHAISIGHELPFRKKEAPRNDSSKQWSCFYREALGLFNPWQRTISWRSCRSGNPFPCFKKKISHPFFFCTNSLPPPLSIYRNKRNSNRRKMSQWGTTS